MTTAPATVPSPNETATSSRFAPSDSAGAVMAKRRPAQPGCLRQPYSDHGESRTRGPELRRRRGSLGAVGQRYRRA
jgi:hypothetical protein